MIKIKTNNVRTQVTREPLIKKELFPVPVYERFFSDHYSFKQNTYETLIDDELYVRNTQRDTLKFSHPNLHKELIFKPFVEFINETVAEVFTDLGYVPKFEITGLWATRQNITNGYHHRHIHHNSFISGVYYFNGDSEKTKGTNFFSDWKDSLIRPSVISEKSVKFYTNCTIPFEEGKVLIFPSWMEHGTPFNPDDSERIILSFNCMPIGKTNTDPFERYNYQSTENVEMISYNDERYK